ncbi:lipoprotein [Klebsiella pneumoniae subsp. rhinoscleromatis]|nr:lipoprotein [Klebsiella pneumoniae subsp. rhinoscleromatis]
MKSPFFFLVTAVLPLTGCNQPAEAESVSGGGGTIEAINHTHWAINHFSVNGQSGVDIIGPWQGGGAGYFGVPSKWEHGMTVKLSGRQAKHLQMTSLVLEMIKKFLSGKKK